jgi:hypothetical protein
MVRQPSPTNAGTCRGENAGDGDKSQPSLEACLGFYKIRKKGALVMRGRGTGKADGGGVRAGSHWLDDGGLDRVTPAQKNTRGRRKRLDDVFWRVWILERMIDDEGLLSLMSYTSLGDGCLRIRCQRTPV